MYNEQATHNRSVKCEMDLPISKKENIIERETVEIKKIAHFSKDRYA